MSEVTSGWKHVAIVTEGSVVSLVGHDPWSSEWRRIPEPPITVAHPTYPAQHQQMRIYKLAVEPPVRFAAGECSNGVWGF